ncbi:hypothetical protein QBC44DRAFT_253952 [Cladorrhinum sp. PSN332]|nr:hypothetical protein QBC44DRAFT_253952 [Cladorrhinum sp. PSN332]
MADFKYSRTISKALEVRLDDKEETDEGHIFEGTLTWDGTPIWGPASCHDNTVVLREALHAVDPRFDFTFTKKDRTTEGHTKVISVEKDGKILLDNLSTHDNMIGLVQAINGVKAGAGL